MVNSYIRGRFWLHITIRGDLIGAKTLPNGYCSDGSSILLLYPVPAMTCRDSIPERVTHIYIYISKNIPQPWFHSLFPGRRSPYVPTLAPHICIISLLVQWNYLLICYLLGSGYGMKPIPITVIGDEDGKKLFRRDGYIAITSG